MTTKPREKMFIEILKRLKAIILKDQLQAGDKLPSERELSERLGVGRSSVREALRAMELLGLIETRRGEGTFIKESRKHRLVEVLASFILDDATAKQELAETRSMIEQDAVMLATKRRTEPQLKELERILQQMKEREGVSSSMDWEFFQAVMKAAHNSLLNRLWVELIEYDDTSSAKKQAYILTDYERIVTQIRKGRESNRVETV